jgi:Uri superfamily endonuclease
MIKSKKCYKCKKTRLIKFFGKNKNSKDGFYTYCKQCKKEDDKKYSENNKEKILKQHKEYYLQNKNKISKQKQEYQERTKDKRRIYKREYERNRKANDPIYRLIQNYKNRIAKAIKGIGKKSQNTTTLLGCSIEKFAEYIEAKFTTGMNWDNQGKWHIDHIIPISSSKKLEDIEKLFHYTNCQPLWAKDNLSKSNKFSLTLDNTEIR